VVVEFGELGRRRPLHQRVVRDLVHSGIRVRGVQRAGRDDSDDRGRRTSVLLHVTLVLSADHSRALLPRSVGLALPDNNRSGPSTTESLGALTDLA
jgi:hypothetical protein